MAHSLYKNIFPFCKVPKIIHSKKPPSILRMRAKNKKNKFLDDFDDYPIYGFSPSSFSSSFDDDRFFQGKERYTKKPDFKPRNDNQRLYLELLENPKKSIILATGPAGTGKTMIPSYTAIDKLLDSEINKIIITRPAVSVEEQHGFLPGTLEEKMEPWLKPIFDVFYQFTTPQKIQSLIAKQIIEICPLAYMRGRTFENSWIIADESQNMTPNQMLMLLTRIGNNSKMIITGDERQHDRGFEDNGLNDFIKKLEGNVIEDIEHIKFTNKDVERHKVIPKILKLYN